MAYSLPIGTVGDNYAFFVPVSTVITEVFSIHNHSLDQR